MELLPTQIGPYQIEKEIGRGRMVWLFQAYDTLYERAVALKVLPPFHHAHSEPESQHHIIRRFISEGREAIRLRHPNIVETFDAGLADGYHYTALALAEGGTLADLLAAQPGYMPIERAIELLLQVAAGIDWAHNQGNLHNGIKPSNILLTLDGAPQLTNFDLVGRRVEEHYHWLANGNLDDLGYLSPEQVRGIEQTTTFTDIYATGVLAYRLLTGRTPFQAPNGLALLYLIGAELPQLPSEVNPILPKSIDQVLLHAIGKEPANRWPTARALVHALEQASHNNLPMTSLDSTGHDGTTDNQEETTEHVASPFSPPPLAPPVNDDSAVVLHTPLQNRVTQDSQSQNTKAHRASAKIFSTLIGRDKESHEFSTGAKNQDGARGVSPITVTESSKHMRTSQHRLWQQLSKEKIALGLAGIIVGLVALALLLAAGTNFFGNRSPRLTLLLEQTADEGESIAPDEVLLNIEPTLVVTETFPAEEPKIARNERSVPNQTLEIQGQESQVVPVPLIPYRGTGDGYRISLPPNPIVNSSRNSIRFTYTELPFSQEQLSFTLHHLPWTYKNSSEQKELITYLEEHLQKSVEPLENLYFVDSLNDDSQTLNVLRGKDGEKSENNDGDAQQEVERIDSSQSVEFRWEAWIDKTPQLLRLHVTPLNESIYVLISQISLAEAPQMEALIDSVFLTFQAVEPIPLAILAPTFTRTPQQTATVPPTKEPQPTETQISLPTPSPLPQELLPAATNFLAEQVRLTSAEQNSTAIQSTLAEAEPIDEAGSNTGTSDSGIDKSNLAPQVPDNAPPLGGRIAYAIWNPLTLGMDTYIYTIGIGLDTLPIPNKRQPDFRHDGWLAFNSLGGGVDNLVRSTQNGQNLVVISAHPEDSRPHWAPSGKMFVFDSTLMGDREQRIYLSADINEKEEEKPIELRPMMYDFYQLFGRYPIFVTNDLVAYNGCNVWENGGSCGIYRVRIDGSIPSQVTSWPRDFPTDNLGSQILFMSERDSDSQVDNWDIYLVNSDGANLRRLTEHPAHDGLATASPDGEYIAFVTDREGPWSVYVMRSDGSSKQKLFTINGEFGPGTQYWEYDWKQERLSWGN
ncbi:MAG: protein kinase [Chloroflexota bacterium]